MRLEQLPEMTINPMFILEYIRNQLFEAVNGLDADQKKLLERVTDLEKRLDKLEGRKGHKKSHKVDKKST